MCQLPATHDVVPCSIELDEQTMLPFNAVFYTSSGMKRVRRNALTDGREALLTKDGVLHTPGGDNVGSYGCSERYSYPWARTRLSPLTVSTFYSHVATVTVSTTNLLTLHTLRTSLPILRSRLVLAFRPNSDT